MDIKRSLLITLAMTIGLATAAQARFAETFVEPYFKDCDGNVIRPYAFGTTDGTRSDQDVDGDERFENIDQGGDTEDEDGDPIFETIQAAVNNTSAGGIVNIMAAGVYREQVTMDLDITIRGRGDGDVILEGACLESPGVAFDDLLGGGITWRLENLSFHGWGTAVRMGSGDALTLVNCRIDDCGTGVSASTDTLTVVGSRFTNCSTDAILCGPDTQVADTVIEGCGRGINGSGGALRVTNCRILRSTNEGIKVDAGSGVFDVTVHGTQIANSGDRGIELVGRISTVNVTESMVEASASDGVYVENNGGCLAGGPHQTKVIVAHSRVINNGDDGIELVGSGTSCPPSQPSTVVAGVFGNTLSMNVNTALDANSTGSFDCELGLNQILYNGAAGTGCTGAGNSNSNSVQ